MVLISMHNLSQNNQKKNGKNEENGMQGVRGVEKIYIKITQRR